MKKTTTKTTKVTPVELNATVSINYDELLTEFNSAKCKFDLVNVCNAHNIYTTTTPTITPNTSDLYIQFFDKSRLLISKKYLKVLTCEKFANELTELDNQFKFTPCSDGTYRVVNATVNKSVDNLKSILEFFATKPMFFCKNEP